MQATVREWHDDLGWGVLDSEETPGGCWVHFSMIETPTISRSGDEVVRELAALNAGDTVELEWEEGAQDGFAFRAVSVWPRSADGPRPIAGGGT